MKFRKSPEMVKLWEVYDATGLMLPQRCFYRETARDLAKLLTKRDDPPGRFRVRRIRQERHP